MTEPAVALEGLERRYGERPALAGVTLHAASRARRLAVFGANGAGKTTLLRVLATLLRPHAGARRGARRGAAARRRGRCAAGSATSGTSRCSTASSPRARTSASTRACTGRARARRGAARRGGPRAPRRRAGARALARDASSGSRRRARCCTTRRCCCSTSRAPTSTRAAEALLEPLIGARVGPHARARDARRGGRARGVRHRARPPRRPAGVRRRGRELDQVARELYR